jgi:hypothetical protein
MFHHFFQNVSPKPKSDEVFIMFYPDKAKASLMTGKVPLCLGNPKT